MISTPVSRLDRRSFLKTAALGATALSLAPSLSAAEPVRRRNIKLGLDNFAVRGMKWKADALIDYAVKLKTDSLFITDLDAFENFDDGYLAGLRKKAADQGLQIQLGTWSICPTAKSFKKNWGTAEEHGALAIRVAKALGSPVARVILGGGEDRRSEGGIEARIEDTVKICKALRSRCLDSGVKIAVENHAGDMQARELISLIEAAGKDYVGANMDSGNAAWTMEDPLSNLEILGPYVLTTSLRDTMIWETPKGAMAQWVAMGDGCVDLKAYFDTFEKLCPGVPVHIETMAYGRELTYLSPDFWKVWPKYPAAEFARFLALARKGKAVQAGNANDASFQKELLERSLTYCKEVLGLGLKS
jgi:sugar phosphate isomerase/epimerase